MKTVLSKNKYNYPFGLLNRNYAIGGKAEIPARRCKWKIGAIARPDPIMAPDESPYNYVGNDPINFYDVAGLYSTTFLWGLAEHLYQATDTGHDLAMSMMEFLGIGPTSGDGGGSGLGSPMSPNGYFKRIQIGWVGISDPHWENEKVDWDNLPEPEWEPVYRWV